MAGCICPSLLWCRFGGGSFVAGVRSGLRPAPDDKTGVIVMPLYLLSMHKADDDNLSPEQTRQCWADVNALAGKMRGAGAFVFKSGLVPAESATVVRRSGSDFLVTDGPYAETKDHLAGFWIINAADLDEALTWAKLATVAEQLPIEVRPFFGGDLDDAIFINTSPAEISA